MKKLNYYSVLLLAATLAGCSNELGTPAVNPDYVEPGTAAMQIAIDFKQPKGYAVGDEDAGAATDAEKEIKSLAFFVKTSHAFGKYYSEAPVGTPNGFTQPLAEVAKGSYTASILVRSTKFVGNSEVIAIANYKENGLDFTDITTIKQLKEMMTGALDGTANLKAPLLMYGDDAAVSLRDTETDAVALVMNRMVARLDVVNKAISKSAQPADHADDFVLKSVRLLNAPSQSMLLPDLRQNLTPIAELPLRKLGDLVADGNPADDTDSIDGQTAMRNIYLYESLNDALDTDPTHHPLIEVKGVFRGSPFTKEIPFKTADQPGIPGEYFAIQRNYRYILTITPARGTGEVDFAITAKDWAEGNTIQVKPSIKSPKLENFVANGDLTAEGVTWDAGTTTLTMTKPVTGAVTLTFDASAYQAPKCAVVAKKTEGQPDDMAFITVADHVKMGDLVSYAGEGEGEGDPVDPPVILDPDKDAPMPLKRTVTLTLPTTVTQATKGSTHTNYLRVQVSESYYTDVTIVYVESRDPVAP